MSASYLLLSTLLAVCFLFYGVSAQCSSSSGYSSFFTNIQYSADVASTPSANLDYLTYNFDPTTSGDCSVDAGTGPVGYGQDIVLFTCTATGSKILHITHADMFGYLGTCDFSFTVQSSSVPITLTHSQNDIPCNGYGAVGSATVVASGSSGYSYAWVDSNNNPMPSSTATLSGISAGSYTVTVSASGATSASHTFTITEPAALTATTSRVSDITCHGAANGQATVSVSGGTTPYTYLWSNNDATATTSTPLGPGSYTVTVSDAHSCPVPVAPAAVTINDPAAFIATTSIFSDITCHGAANGKATVSASGGTGPYTYLWSNTDATATTTTPLVAGSYTVTVTDSRGCSPSATPSSVTITDPAALSATIPTFTHNTCPSGTSGTATLSAITGGTSPYQILWSPTSATTQGITGLAAGVYTATITDAHSCTISPSVTITSPGSFVITPSHTNVNCPGGNDGTATVTVTGGSAPYTYLWSSGDTTQTATGLIAGTYTVTITDNGGCSATSAAITVTAPAAFVTTPSHNDVSCHGGTTGSASVAITGGTAPYSYSWSTGPTTQTLPNIGGGTYTVQLHDNNNCPIPSVSITVNDPPQLTATLNVNDIACNGGTGTATLTVTGGTGAKTYTWSNSVASSSSATATGLAAGSYTVSVTDANSCASSPQTSFSFTITNPPAVSGVITPTQPQCPGGVGSASVVASGGTGSGYTYAWSPSGGSSATAAGLASGSYSVLITDQNGCTASPTVTITAPATFVTSISATPATCHGTSTGTATVTISGGTTPYVYNWVGSASSTNVASGLPAGSISVSATDAHNCPIGPLSVTVTEPGDMTLASVVTDVTCNGAHDGTAGITSVTGGTSPYTYAWVGGSTASSRTGLGPGTYAVTITDNSGCTKQTSFTITEPDGFHGLGVSNVVNAQCFGGTGSVSMQPIGGQAPYTYSWSSPIISSLSSVSGLPVGLYSVSATDHCGEQQSAIVSITQPNVLLLFPQQTNVACHGTSTGRALVYAEGGTPPYTYAWSPSGGTGPAARNLAAGTYSVTVTDSHGCTQSVTFIITEPDAFAITPTITQPLCKGDDNGAIALAVVGGTDRYVYQWVPSSAGAGASVSNIKAGTYSVVITDAEFCSQTRTYTVAEPTKLTITGTQVNVACHGGSSGSATVVASGGSGAYTYSWSPSGGSTASASGLSAGTYVVTVTDAHGCITTRSFTITEPGVLAIAPSQVNVACRGQSSGSATAVVSGGSGTYTFAWAPSITTTASTASGLAIGTYGVTVTDSNSCTTTHSYTITEPASVLAIASSSHVDVLCHGSSTGSATVTVSGGTAGYTYAWTPSGQTGATATGLAAGAHSVTVTDANGCTVSQSFTVLEPAPLTAQGLVEDNVCHGQKGASAAVSVAGGTAPYNFLWSTGGNVSEVNKLGAGRYVVTVTDAGSCVRNVTINVTEPAPFCVHGTCTGLKTCKCAKGWNGTDCSAPVCESPCLNGGVCTAPYTCSCPEAWTGPVCNISTNYTISTAYVIKLVQLYKRGANISIPEYVALLATAMNIPVSSINVTQELYTVGNSKRAIPKTYTKLICTISLNKTGTSFNRTQEMVLEAANSTEVRNYLEANGSDSASNTCYIYTIELQTIYEGVPPKSNNNRKLRLGLGVGLGLGIPIIAFIIVGAYYISRRRRETRTPREGGRM